MCLVVVSFCEVGQLCCAQLLAGDAEYVQHGALRWQFLAALHDTLEPRDVIRRDRVEDVGAGQQVFSTMLADEHLQARMAPCP